MCNLAACLISFTTSICDSSTNWSIYNFARPKNCLPPVRFPLWILADAAINQPKSGCTNKCSRRDVYLIMSAYKYLGKHFCNLYTNQALTKLPGHDTCRKWYITFHYILTEGPHPQTEVMHIKVYEISSAYEYIAKHRWNEYTSCSHYIYRLNWNQQDIKVA